MIIYKLGEFEVTGDKLLACDPCYIKDGSEPWFNLLIENVLPGTYVAEVTVFDNDETHGWGDRNSELMIYHKDHYSKSRAFPSICISEDDCVGVDSGQALFIDKKHYDEYMGKSNEDKEEFYRNCCDATETDVNAGIVSGIPVSRTGYGDGCYDVFVERNENKKVTAASIVFIDEENLS